MYELILLPEKILKVMIPRCVSASCVQVEKRHYPARYAEILERWLLLQQRAKVLKLIPQQHSMPAYGAGFVVTTQGSC